MALMLKRESAEYATSDVLPASDHLPTVFHVLMDKFFTKEDVGLNVQLFLFNWLEEMLHALITALMDSTKYQSQNVLHAPSNALPAQDHLTTVLLVSMDQSLLKVPAPLHVDRINLLSKVTV